ncbi:MAG TPA: DNA mismatch repair protein MutS [Deltaproteobacteria bacterium]|nr:DNA mismatch repair protein MutS [Deltaproteobacteria bacterium]
MMTNITPMMQQYRTIKEQHKDAILFYRMGDFYEMFHEDAREASRILGIALTTRDKNKDNPVPMCGVPYHSASAYISRLIRMGMKVAICEQSQSGASERGLVHREVVQVITPGLLTDDRHLLNDRANYLMAVSKNPRQEMIGVAFIDISTGDFRATEVASSLDFINELHRVCPSEIIVTDTRIIPEGFFVTPVSVPLETERAVEILSEHFGTVGIDGLGLKDRDEALTASAMVLDYVRQTQKAALAHITALRFYNPGRFMILGSTTTRNLELFDAITGEKKNTLFSVLNHTCTSMGARKLADWMCFPHMDIDGISRRHDAVEALCARKDLLSGLRVLLGGIPDMERIIGRICAGSASPRDIVALGGGLEQVPRIQEMIDPASSGLLAELRERLDDLDEVRSRIFRTLVPDPPNKLSDTGVIASGVDEELDDLRLLRRDSKQYLASLETRERQATGINTLKIGFNKVFGYYIEVSKATAEKAPQHYIRKQTLTNAERYITPELKEYEAKLLGAQDAITQIEMRIFAELREYLVGFTVELKRTVDAISSIDVLANFAQVALEYGYARPEITLDRTMEIISGRHPVVERVLKSGEFVPNSCSFKGERDTIHIITGPNMAGKSTFMRQVALISLMAQMGSFVPAREATIGIVDRIFTRIGALDNLSAGQSTFLVEMSETADILNNATPHSLVILDEIGRGTSTYDGMSLAWAVAEYLDKQCIRTFFATHYHELADLARRHQGIKNYHMAVDETGGEVVFLRALKRGAIGRSYGIHVARLAGIPEEVVEKARILLAGIGKKSRTVPVVHEQGPVQQSLFEDEYSQIIEELLHIDVERLRPIDAISILQSLKDRVLNPD